VGKLLLNAGCGAHHPEGWTGVDIDPECKPDVVASLMDLPFPDRSCGRIFASHVLEHLDYWTELPAALHEMQRVLADDGELFIVGPDIERAILTGEPRQLLETIIHWPGEYSLGWAYKVAPVAHAWTPSASLMEHVLDAGRFQFQSLTGHLRDAPGLGWPLANHGDWQHAYICRKDFSS